MQQAMEINDHSMTDDGGDGDGEGVWSPDIERCFREALILFPPCGRRKHILQEEGGGKMYGRNELIARHIRMQTGKIRTRKQVSSHIQVLARRKARAESSKDGSDSGAGSSSPASAISMPTSTASVNNHLVAHNIHANQPQHFNDGLSPTLYQQHNHHQQLITNAYYDIWADRPIVTKKLRLVEFSAFVEYRRQPQLTPLYMSAAGNASSPALALANLASATIENLNQSSNLNSVMSHDGSLAPFNSEVNAGLLSQPPNSITHPHNLTPIIEPYGHHHHNHQHYAQTTNGNQLHQPLNNNQHHHQQLNQRNNLHHTDYMLSSGVPPTSLNHQHQSSSTSVGFTRHSYVKIDYRQPMCRQTTKLERIDISQIQDKFPEILGSDGLYQRGPSDAFFLVKFWADLNNDDYEYNIEDQNSYFGFSCYFESLEPYKDITCSTKACSYGLQVVEKVEKIHGALNNSNGRYSFDIDRSPMCEFMTQFIKKLRQLPRVSQMNSVLENFTVLQVVTSESTSEILLCLAFVFEVASREQNNGSQYHVYKLTKE